MPGDDDGSLRPPTPAGHVVEVVPGARARKPYVCPGCDGTIAPGVGHVVSWPEELVDLRRHWHRHCWRLAVRSGRTQGS